MTCEILNIKEKKKTSIYAFSVSLKGMEQGY